MADSSSIIRIAPIELVSSRLPADRLIMASGIDDLSDHRKFHGERRAGSRRAVHTNLAGVLLDDAVGHGQAQSGASAVAGLRFVLGGEERIVDAVNVLLSNSASGVAHR